MNASSAEPTSSVVPEIFVARQPILDRDQRLAGFELLFRWAVAGSAGVIDNVHATATVMANTLGAIGLHKLVANHTAFINFTAELLLSDVIELLPPDRVVLEILESVEIDTQLSDRLLELKRKGYRLALDDVVGPVDSPLLQQRAIDVVKLDLVGIPAEALSATVRHFKRWNLMVLAEKVETREQAQHCKALGVDLFQGYYFARPETVTGKRTDPSKAALLQLLSRILGDATEREIELELKHHTDLTFHLLRLVNSPSVGVGRKMTSIKQCIVVLGRQQLQRWVQLLVYAAGPGKGMTPPLLHVATVRAKLMENLAVIEWPDQRLHQDQAFMAGFLSLMDVLFDMALPDILKEVSLADEMVSALLTREGRLGRLLLLAENTEGEDRAAMERALADFPRLSPTFLAEAQLSAIAWADEIALT